MKKILYTALPFIVLSTILSGLVYVSIQQTIRMSANDPQIQIAEDSAALLVNGVAPEAVTGSSIVDIDKSLAVFISIFDEKGTLVKSSARLHDITPVPPSGVFDYTRMYGEDRLTWQPAPDARSAIVIKHYGGQNPGFVLVGRSLREVEVRENQLFFFVFVAWFIAIIAILGIVRLTGV